jgi:hypothetical protein
MQSCLADSTGCMLRHDIYLAIIRVLQVPTSCTKAFSETTLFSNMQPLANGLQRKLSAVTQAALAPVGGISEKNVGVGLMLKFSDETGCAEIVGFRKGSPAELCGLLSPSGDILYHVDDRSIYQMQLNEVVNLILGPVNSHVTLTVKKNKPDSAYRRVTLTRASVVSGATPAAQNLVDQCLQNLLQQQEVARRIEETKKQLSHFSALQPAVTSVPVAAPSNGFVGNSGVGDTGLLQRISAAAMLQQQLVPSAAPEQQQQQQQQQQKQQQQQQQQQRQQEQLPRQLQQEERQRTGEKMSSKQLAEFLAPQVIQNGLSAYI